jgi:glycosyltransferase involved in cell wall biosynthesis
MRVAIVAEVFWPKVDGVVNRTLNLIRRLARAGDDLLVICPDGQPPRGERIGTKDEKSENSAHSSFSSLIPQPSSLYPVDVPVVAVPSFPFLLYPEYRIGLPDRRLIRALRQFAPDIIHYINPFSFGFRCYDLFRKAGLKTPTVFSFHTLYGEFVKQYQGLKSLSAVLWWLMREYHNRADINLTVSGIMRDELVQRGFKRVRLWPPAVDSDLFHPSRKNAAMRARLSGDRSHKPLLLTVSRLAPEKNVGFLAGVIRQLPGVSLAVVGDGPQRAELERLFDGLDVRFQGYLRGEDLAAAYASADAFVYASETETMGNVVLEAMACGCPVVAPHAGGIPNLLSHGMSGFLYRPRNLEDAVHWTRAVMEDETLRNRLSQSARQLVEERTWEHSIGRVRQIYAETIQTARRPVSSSSVQQQLAQATTLTLVSAFRSLAAAKRARRRAPSPTRSGAPIPSFRLPRLKLRPLPWRKRAPKFAPPVSTP